MGYAFACAPQSLKAERSKDEAAWQVSNYRTGEVQDLPPRLRDIFEENKVLPVGLPLHVSSSPGWLVGSAIPFTQLPAGDAGVTV